MYFLPAAGWAPTGQAGQVAQMGSWWIWCLPVGRTGQLEGSRTHQPGRAEQLGERIKLARRGK